jgi:hypothetical protein
MHGRKNRHTEGKIKIRLKMKENQLRSATRVAAIWVFAMVSLSACGTPPVTPPTGDQIPLGTPVKSDDQATLAVVLTQEKNSADNQAAATAEIVRADAQATMNSANATLNSVQLQNQNDANLISAQLAATAEFERANAQATSDSADSTQSAALTQDAIRQTHMADQATTDAEAMLIQQNEIALAAGTQTAGADLIATQTQIAVATSQWYADQARQRDEQRKQGPLGFLWMWCPPLFLVLLAGLLLWGLWRWLKIQQANQLILENPVDKLPHMKDEPLDSHLQLNQPDDQIPHWLDEVKRELLSNDKKDEDGNTYG